MKTLNHKNFIKFISLITFMACLLFMSNALAITGGVMPNNQQSKVATPIGSVNIADPGKLNPGGNTGDNVGTDLGDGYHDGDNIIPVLIEVCCNNLDDDGDGDIDEYCCGNGITDICEECDFRDPDRSSLDASLQCNRTCEIVCAETGLPPNDNGECEQCGNGNIDPGETCDPNHYPAPGYGWNAEEFECVDCQKLCINTGEPPLGDTCPGEECGNGILEPDNNEACDDGNQDNTDSCTIACLKAACGDGYNQNYTLFDRNMNMYSYSEECDDGNTVSGDGCSSDCTLEQTITHECGNNILESGEQCDDGNHIDGDGCSANCTLELVKCGNGKVETGEQCDDGNTSNNDICLNTCIRAKCGDTYVRTGVEECDDGNTANDDGCSALCKIEEEKADCGNNVKETGEECDGTDGVTDPALVCKNCELVCKSNGQPQTPGAACPGCGNGVLEQPKEECDDGNTANGDGCSALCKIEEEATECGNGIKESGEECDGTDGITDSTKQECINCEIVAKAYCGDGSINQNYEQCDDGGNLDGDGCSANCQTEEAVSCGNKKVDAGEECDETAPLSDQTWDTTKLTCVNCELLCKNTKQPPEAGGVCPECGDGVVQADHGEQCEEGVTALNKFETCSECQIECLPGTHFDSSSKICKPDPCEDGSDPVYALCQLNEQGDIISCIGPDGEVITEFDLANVPGGVASMTVSNNNLLLVSGNNQLLRLNVGNEDGAKLSYRPMGNRNVETTGVNTDANGNIISWNNRAVLLGGSKNIIQKPLSENRNFSSIAKATDGTLFGLSENKIYRLDGGNTTIFTDLNTLENDAESNSKGMLLIDKNNNLKAVFDEAIYAVDTSSKNNTMQKMETPIMANTVSYNMQDGHYYAVEKDSGKLGQFDLNTGKLDTSTGYQTAPLDGNTSNLGSSLPQIDTGKLNGSLDQTNPDDSNTDNSVDPNYQDEMPELVKPKNTAWLFICPEEDSCDCDNCCDECEITTIYVCADGTEVDDPDNCPTTPPQVITEIKTETETIYVCSDGTEVEEISACPLITVPETEPTIESIEENPDEAADTVDDPVDGPDSAYKFSGGALGCSLNVASSSGQSLYWLLGLLWLVPVVIKRKR